MHTGIRIMSKYVVILLFLFISVAASEDEVADVCNGMGCTSSYHPSCSLYFDSELQKIILKKNNLLCKDKFQIQKKDLIISFCRSSIDSLCARNKKADKLFICQNPGMQISESRFYKDSDSLSQHLLFELALNGEFNVIKNGKQSGNAYYVKQYSLFCQIGGQRGEMIFLDKENWLLFRNNHWLWI